LQGGIQAELFSNPMYKEGGTATFWGGQTTLPDAQRGSGGHGEGSFLVKKRLRRSGGKNEGE